MASKELLVEEDRSKRAIGKVHPDARVSDLGADFDDPQGLALGPDGALYLADGRGGRLLRLAAPAPPALTVPAVTNETALDVRGSTVGGARVDLFVDEATTGLTTLADSTGASNHIASTATGTTPSIPGVDEGNQLLSDESLTGHPCRPARRGVQLVCRAHRAPRK